MGHQELWTIASFKPTVVDQTPNKVTANPDVAVETKWGTLPKDFLHTPRQHTLALVGSALALLDCGLKCHSSTATHGGREEETEKTRTEELGFDGVSREVGKLVNGSARS